VNVDAGMEALRAFLAPPPSLTPPPPPLVRFHLQAHHQQHTASQYERFQTDLQGFIKPVFFSEKRVPRLQVHRLEVAVNVDAGMEALRAYFVRSTREAHNRGTFLDLDAENPEAVLPVDYQPLEVQLEAIEAFHTWWSGKLRSFKVQTPSPPPNSTSSLSLGLLSVELWENMLSFAKVVLSHSVLYLPV